MVAKILQGILQRGDINGDGRVVRTAVNETVWIKFGVGIRAALLSFMGFIGFGMRKMVGAPSCFPATAARVAGW